MLKVNTNLNNELKVPIKIDLSSESASESENEDEFCIPLSESENESENENVDAPVQSSVLELILEETEPKLEQSGANQAGCNSNKESTIEIELNQVHSENKERMKKINREVKELKNEIEIFDNYLIQLKNSCIHRIASETDLVIALENKLFPPIPSE